MKTKGHCLNCGKKLSKSNPHRNVCDRSCAVSLDRRINREWENRKS